MARRNRHFCTIKADLFGLKIRVSLVQERIYSAKLGQRVHYLASPVAADGKIYFCSYLGTVFVVKAGDEFKILAQSKMGERIKATPALVDGNIYLRTATQMMAFGGS